MNSWESRECHRKKKIVQLGFDLGEVLFEKFEGISNIPSAACHNKSSLFSKSPCFTLKTTICGQNISTNIYNLLTLTKRSIKIIYFFLISKLDLNVESQNYIYIIWSKITKLKSLNLIWNKKPLRVVLLYISPSPPLPTPPPLHTTCISWIIWFHLLNYNNIFIFHMISQ